MVAYKKANIAVVFRGKLPEKFMGLPVIDGGKHDLRFLDPNPNDKQVVVGLKAKGKALHDETGFAIKN